MATQARGKVTIDTKECKGCGICVDACPPKCLLLLAELNAYGVHPAHYSGRELFRLRHLFLCLPGTGSNHGVPVDCGKGGESANGGKPCGNSVRAMWRL